MLWYTHTHVVTTRTHNTSRDLFAFSPAVILAWNCCLSFANPAVTLSSSFCRSNMQLIHRAHQSLRRMKYIFTGRWQEWLGWITWLIAYRLQGTLYTNRHYIIIFIILCVTAVCSNLTCVCINSTHQQKMCYVHMNCCQRDDCTYTLLLPLLQCSTLVASNWSWYSCSWSFKWSSFLCASANLSYIGQ